MVAAFEIVCIPLLWVITLWRARSALREGKERGLWTAFCGVAVAMTMRPYPFGLALDRLSGVNDLSFLVKHLAGGVVAPAGLIAFVQRMSSSQWASSGYRRLRMALPILTGLAMVLLFVATPRPLEAADLLSDYASDGRITAYGTIWISYLLLALAAAARICWQWGRQAGMSLLGWGLRTVGAGAGVGIVYALHRIAAVLLRYARNSVPSTDTSDTTSTGLLVCSVLLFVIGSSLPALDKLRGWLRARTDLSQLYGLWHALTDATPSVRLDPPRGRSADLLDTRRIRKRLYRRTIEIRDAALTLSEHIPTALREQADEYVAGAGIRGTAAATAAEACCLEVARRARLRDDAPPGEHQLPAGGGRDLLSETQALKQLAHAFRSDLTHTFADTVDSARTLGDQP
ncbi:MAB_1171c family putative transporter [Actinacidiphila soli]|uniref:MAB_1171c family putative transporter n=1 Tax=Actinacidiphila soli TaxID=2487275 RepID=UPI000FCABB4A|nr:MAB_1171c family putative transporter [Actinacidiphila soli]